MIGRPQKLLNLTGFDAWIWSAGIRPCQKYNSDRSKKLSFYKRQTGTYKILPETWTSSPNHSKGWLVLLYFSSQYFSCVCSMDILKVHAERHISNWHIYILKLGKVLISAGSFFLYRATLLTHYRLCLLSIYFFSVDAGYKVHNNSILCLSIELKLSLASPVQKGQSLLWADPPLCGCQA